MVTGVRPAPSATSARRGGLLVVLTAHTFASAGLAMTFIAMPWFVLETTGSVARTGMVVAGYTAGAAIAGFLAGPLVDRLGFKRVAVSAYLVGGAAMAGIVLLYHLDALSFPALLGLVLVATAFDAPGAVALSGLIPGLARAAGTPLERANSALRGISNLTQLLGPLLGGVATVLVGPHNVLLLDAAGGAVAALLVAGFVSVPRRDAAAGAPAAASRTVGLAGYLGELRQGLRTLRRSRLLRAVTAIGAVHNLLDGGLIGIVLIMVAFHWYGDAASFGMMMSAFGLGALLGTVGYGAVGHRLRRRPVFVTAAIVVGLPLLVVGTAPPLWATATALALVGLAAAPIGPLTTSALQQQVPAELYGRVVGTIRVLTAVTAPLGVSIAALLVIGYGLQSTVVGMSLFYLAIGVGIAITRAFRDLDRPPDPASIDGPAGSREVVDRPTTAEPGDGVDKKESI